MPVTYMSRRIEARRLEDAIASDGSADGPPSLAAMKFANWRYENEVRLWARLDDEGPDLQFAMFGPDMKLRSVHLGPRCDVTRAQITEALGELASDVKIVTTRLAFRTFRVVTQRDRSRWAERRPTRSKVSQVVEGRSHHICVGRCGRYFERNNS